MMRPVSDSGLCPAPRTKSRRDHDKARSLGAAARGSVASGSGPPAPLAARGSVASGSTPTPPIAAGLGPASFQFLSTLEGIGPGDEEDEFSDDTDEDEEFNEDEFDDAEDEFGEDELE